MVRVYALLSIAQTTCHGGDRAAAAQESSLMSQFEEEGALRPTKPVLGRAPEAAIIALHRPAAV